MLVARIHTYKDRENKNYETCSSTAHSLIRHARVTLAAKKKTNRDRVLVYEVLTLWKCHQQRPTSWYRYQAYWVLATFQSQGQRSGVKWVDGPDQRYINYLWLSQLGLQSPSFPPTPPLTTTSKLSKFHRSKASFTQADQNANLTHYSIGFDAFRLVCNSRATQSCRDKSCCRALHNSDKCVYYKNQESQVCRCDKLWWCRFWNHARTLVH